MADTSTDPATTSSASHLPPFECKPKRRHLMHSQHVNAQVVAQACQAAQTAYSSACKTTPASSVSAWQKFLPEVYIQLNSTDDSHPPASYISSPEFGSSWRSLVIDLSRSASSIAECIQALKAAGQTRYLPSVLQDHLVGMAEYLEANGVAPEQDPAKVPKSYDYGW